MRDCRKCGAWLIGNNVCNCVPFEAYHEDFGEWITVHAMDAEEAAEAAAKKHWEDDPPEDEDTVEMLIRQAGGTVSRYTVEATFRINYRAHVTDSDVADPIPED